MADEHMVIENDDQGECGLLEIVNEHNEVLGVVLSHTEPRHEAPIAEENSSSESETDPNEVPIAETNPKEVPIAENSSSESETDPNEVPIAETNPKEVPIAENSSSESETDTPDTPSEAPIAEENMFSSSESESDTPNYILESSDSEQEEDNIPHIRVPLKNYSRDMEDPDDFVNNWRWVIEDTGPSYGPFTGMPGMNIPPKKSDPISYFELFFDPAMYTRIAGETNQYANQRYQKFSGDLPFLIHDNYSTVTGQLHYLSFSN